MALKPIGIEDDNTFPGRVGTALTNISRNAVIIPTKPYTDAPNTYPKGVTVMQSDGGGYPAEFGTVETVRYDTNRSYQTVVDRPTGRTWQRTPAPGDGSWMPWIQIGVQGNDSDYMHKKGLDILWGRLSLRDREVVPIIFAGSSTPNGGYPSRDQNRFTHRFTRALQFHFPLDGKSNPEPANTDAVATWTNPWGIYGIVDASGGTTSANYMPVDRQDRIAARNPAMVMHMIGSNDYSIQMPIETYKNNIRNAINALRAKGVTNCVHVLVQSFTRLDVTNPVIPSADYGRALKELADENDYTVFVDVSEPFRRMGVFTGGTDPYNMIQSDNVHSGDEGHLLISDMLVSAFGLSNRADSGWIELPLETGFAARNAGFTPMYRVLDNRVQFRGGVIKTAAPPNNTWTANQSTKIATLPSNIRIPLQANFACPTSIFSVPTLVYVIGLDVYVFSGPTAGFTYVMLNPISYLLD